MWTLTFPSQVPSEAEDSEQLRIAFGGWGKYQRLIISTLAHGDAAQHKLTQQTYGVDLLEPMHKKLSSDFERVVLLWSLGPAERDAVLMNEAARWTSTSMNLVLVEIGCTRSTYDLYLIRGAYHVLFKKSIEEDVADHIPGDFRWLLLYLVTSDRSSWDDVNMPLAESEAKILHEKILKKAYGDEEFLRILTIRSRAQTNATLNHYKNEFGHDINKDLKAVPKGCWFKFHSCQFNFRKRKDFFRKRKDLNGFLSLLRATVKCLTCPEKYFEKVIRLAINKCGTDEGALARVITTRGGVDMKKIKDAYQKRNGVTLDRAIAEGTTGYYQKMLLALVEMGSSENAPGLG